MKAPRLSEKTLTAEFAELPQRTQSWMENRSLADDTVTPSADRAHHPLSEWPRISLVTPVLNSAHYLEATLRSVLSQGYPNLEYIVVDGGSTDGGVEIIRQYESQLHHWISEPEQAMQPLRMYLPGIRW